jgi:23S rRNA pseudouridine1911/1915/1917 synthase
MKWTVGPEQGGSRLDKFLAAADRLGSRASASAALDRGKVFLNGVEVSARERAARLASGDVVRVWMDRPGSARRKTARYDDLQIVYEDEALIVIDKPAGLLAVPLERRPDEPSLYEQLKSSPQWRHGRRPFVVHRIDRDTSGLVVFAKTATARDRLKEQFKRHAVERVYLAVVYGHPQPESGTWRDRLVWDQRALIQKAAHPQDQRGKDAISAYRVVERFRQASLVEVRLVTGKRNQIRLQARLRGHTLVGEQRYVFGPELLRPIAFERQALHAHRLRLEHPTSGRPMQFEAPLPPDMTSLLARLRRRTHFAS